ncbi:hypothetical protein P12x_003289 [Tundrisphaera lichenicola]|uniref:hypothetical protein n=1 Tax=Tundrisphaera lichenicola TaxID=2029860 RepID=UPI003EBB4940
MDFHTTSPPEFPDHLAGDWVDPVEERVLLRRRLRRLYLGFSILGLALVLASLSILGHLILLFSGRGGVGLGRLMGVPLLDLVEEAAIVWCSLIGVALLWGRWPDQNWQRRSGLLLMMCLVDLVQWSIDNAAMLGLTEAPFGHEWFRMSLGTALGWSQFALIASLAADMAAHLGVPHALDFGKSARSLATTGAMVWFMYFYFATDWTTPIWPLHRRGNNAGQIMLYLGWLVLYAINLVQITALTLLAGRSCGRTLREMSEEDRRNDHIPSRSEAGWEEMNRPGPHR